VGPIKSSQVTKQIQNQFLCKYTHRNCKKEVKSKNELNFPLTTNRNKKFSLLLSSHFSSRSLNSNKSTDSLWTQNAGSRAERLEFVGRVSFLNVFVLFDKEGIEHCCGFSGL
jgi:hypothetical protein